MDVNDESGSRAGGSSPAGGRPARQSLRLRGLGMGRRQLVDESTAAKRLTPRTLGGRDDQHPWWSS